MTCFLAIVNIIQLQGYQSLFPSPLTREAILSGFADNSALRIFYGYPFDISNAAGWMAWRNMSTIGMVMALWAAFVTVGGLRGEEEAGRAELTLSQPQSRVHWLAAVLVAVSIETLVIGLVSIMAMALVGIPQGLLSLTQCLELSLQMILPALLFSAVAAVTSQLLGTARGARVAAAGVLAVALLLRTPADIGSGITWLRWTSPLGWFEDLHPPAAPSIAAGGAIVVAFAVLVVVATKMVTWRDIGVGLLPHSDSRKPRLWLLTTPWQAALRDEIAPLSLWILGAVAYGALMGGLTRTVLEVVGKDSTFTHLLGSSLGVNAFIAAAVSLTEVIVALLAVTMMVGARGEESSGRLELLIANPLSRTSWLLGAASLAAGVALVIAMLSTLAIWVGAVAIGQSLSLGSMLAAGVNCLPIIVIAVGFGMAVLAFAPRAVGILYAGVAVAYLWDALGTVLKFPSWLLEVSPFHALAQIPAQDFAVLPAIAVTAVGVGLAAAGEARFRARDLVAA
ncbi:MAG: hypothetical protein ABI473_08965 [Candidatus Dormibacter sp.]